MVTAQRFQSVRQRQLSWMPPGAVIRQDQELIAYIQSHGYDRAIGYGPTDFLRPFINFVEQAPEEFVIYIETGPYNFSQLIDSVNRVIDHKIKQDGRLYLSFNKYQAVPGNYDSDLAEDYDQAIVQYVSTRIAAKLEHYLPCGDDRGNKFNWVHPLTRFYFQKT